MTKRWREYRNMELQWAYFNGRWDAREEDSPIIICFIAASVCVGALLGFAIGAGIQ